MNIFLYPAVIWFLQMAWINRGRVGKATLFIRIFRYVIDIILILLLFITIVIVTIVINSRLCIVLVTQYLVFLDNYLAERGIMLR